MEYQRGEIQHRPHPGIDEEIGHTLGHWRRCGDDPDCQRSGCGDGLQVVGVSNLDVIDPLADDGRVGIDEGHHLEITGGEPLTAGQGSAQIADAGDSHGPLAVETELAIDLLGQEGDVIAAAPCPE